MALDFGLGTEGADAITGDVSLGNVGLGDLGMPNMGGTPEVSFPTDIGGTQGGSDLTSAGATALGGTFSGSGEPSMSDVAGPGGLPDFSLGDVSGNFGGDSAGITTGPEFMGAPPQDAFGSLEPSGGSTDLSAQSVQPSATTDDDLKKKAAGGGGGLSPLAKAGIMAAPALGVLGYEASKGPYKPPAMGPLNQTAIQQGALSAQLLNMYNNGQIQPSMAAKITADYLRNVSQINQYYARAGQGDSTQKIGAINKARMDMTTQYQAFLDSELKGALTASGQAGQFFAQAAQIQLKSDAAFNAAIASVTQGIGNIAARYLFPTTTTTTTTRTT